MINRDYENLQKVTNLEREMAIETDAEKQILICNEIIQIASQYSLEPSDEHPGFMTTDRSFAGKRAGALEQKIDALDIIWGQCRARGEEDRAREIERLTKILHEEWRRAVAKFMEGTIRDQN